ncbi:MAG: DMT family transporter [Proteobacteria bacterium]|nr:DMT family transporter [Pseudomonadota bacterium]MDA1356867.1 DMT family transporter [Pseudomonadota bacterium]
MTPREWGMLIVLSMLWGGSFYFVGIAVIELPTFTIVFLRVGIAALGLHVIVRVMGERMPTGFGIWRAFFTMGFLNNIMPFSLIVWGQSHVASGLASILLATTPLFTVVVAHFMTSDERLSGGRLAGIAVGIVGIVILIGSDAGEGFEYSLLAHIALLGAALFYSFGGVYGRRFQRMHVTPIVTATGQITASSLMLLPVALVVDRPWVVDMPGGGTWLALAGLALLSTSLAYILYFRILATAGATNLMLVTFLIPVSAIILGAAFLAERLQVNHFIGMAIIGIGLGAIDGRLLKLALRLWKRA